MTRPDAPYCDHLLDEAFAMLRQHVPTQAREVHQGEPVIRAGTEFTTLYLVREGVFKTVSVAADGRAHVVSLHFPGDWLGFDGIARGRHACDTLALEAGTVCSISYAALLQGFRTEPRLLPMLHAAMSREIGREREALLALRTLSADARVAEFLCSWVERTCREDKRVKALTLCMTRADIGDYLGMTLESVSRALSRLGTDDVIRFIDNDRRHIEIKDVTALENMVHGKGHCGPAVELRQGEAPTAA